MHKYEVLKEDKTRPVKMWTKGVPVEDVAKAQLLQTAELPFIFKLIAVMPDVHLGRGSTVGSVIPTTGAVIPAAVGVDIVWHDGRATIAYRTGFAGRFNAIAAGD